MDNSKRSALLLSCPRDRAPINFVGITVRRQHIYRNVRFTPDVIRNAVETWRTMLEIGERPLEEDSLHRQRTYDFNVWAHPEGYALKDAMISVGDERWWPETLSEFLVDYGHAPCDLATMSLSAAHNYETLEFTASHQNTEVTVKMRSDADTKGVIAVFDSAVDRCLLPIDTVKSNLKRDLTIFIGHGRDRQWQDLKSHLTDQHGFRVSAYETGARAGYTAIKILEQLANTASFALLVHTAEDIDASGDSHARLNVIHETGLFQGRIGFEKAIVLLERGCGEFSNIAGLQQIRFDRGNIAAAFGDVLATIYREFGAEDG
jgi:predicted nucleotide-binding protein